MGVYHVADWMRAAVLLTTQVNVSATAKHVQRQGCKNNESNNKLPHIKLHIKQIKKAPAESTGAFS
jgi:hypothetical protein